MSAYDQLEAEIKELKASQLTLLEEISRLTAETANLEIKEADLEELNRNLNDKSEKLVTVENKISVDQVKLDSLLAEIDEAEKTFGITKNKLSEGQNKLDELNSEVTNQKELQIKLLDEISLLTAEASKLELKQAELNEIDEQLDIKTASF